MMHFDLKEWTQRVAKAVRTRPKFAQGILIISLFLFAFGLSLFGQTKPALSSTEETSATEETDSLQQTIESEERAATIFIHVTGEVMNPGVIEIDPDLRVIDAINLAGGMTEQADMDSVNLAGKLTDGTKITVRAVGETAAEDNTESSGTLVNINTAGKTELMTLPGIGEVTAGNIIAYREENGGFSSLEEIKEVSRIGDKTYEKIESLICI